MMAINEKELEQVSGGFSETNKGLPTQGMNIVCPKCHSSNAASFSQAALYDRNIGSVEYKCKCGCSFVCYQGQVLMKKDWLALCSAKGISYGF